MHRKLLLNFLVSGVLLWNAVGYAQIPVTKIFTDYNGYWVSGSSSAPNPVIPDNSHSLLGFVWNGKTYSTGVNNALLQSHASVDVLSAFTALPTKDVPVPTSNTFIGVGRKYGGVGDVSPVPVRLPLEQYLVDGQHGLDLGTAIFNFPATGQLAFNVSSISPQSIGDGIPDLLVTQLGDINNVKDHFFFQDAAGNRVGNDYEVNFSAVSDLGNADWKFYYVTQVSGKTPPSYNAGPSGNGVRKLRLLAIDWSEFGLNAANITQIAKFVQLFSGQSDLAFVAYNQGSISLKQQISGFVYNDNNAGVPDGNVASGVTLQLQTVSGDVVSTAVTGGNGYYQFGNVAGGSYHIVPVLSGAYAGYKVVGNSKGNVSDYNLVTIENAAATGVSFGINLPPVAVDDELAVDINIPGTVPLTANDYDLNSGTILPASVSLVPPPAAISVVADPQGNYVSFELPGEGKWQVDQTGMLTFTPAANYKGVLTDVRYTVKDLAGLSSNQAVIHLKMDGFCYKDKVTSGKQLDTKAGITALGRAGAEADNWPMVRKGGWLALEAHTKGFVINRIATTAALNAMPKPVEGMMVYDQQAQCLKIYTTLDGGRSYGWRCYNVQSCPD